MSLFLLPVVSIETMSLFQFVGATRLFLEKWVFPIFPYYTHTQNLSNEWEGLLALERNEKKKRIDKSEQLKVHCCLLWGFLIISTFFLLSQQTLKKKWVEFRSLQVQEQRLLHGKCDFRFRNHTYISFFQYFCIQIVLRLSSLQGKNCLAWVKNSLYSFGLAFGVTSVFGGGVSHMTSPLPYT